MLTYLRDIFRRSLQATHPRDPVIADILFGGSNSGIHVSPETAMRASAVNACVRILSESIASLPCALFRRLPDGGKERATDKEQHRLVHSRPNGFHTAFDYRLQAVRHVAMRGVHYSRIAYNGGKYSLIPLHPDRVRAELRDDMSIVYQYQPLRGDKRVYLQGEVLRVTYASDDGIQPISPIRAQSETIGEVQVAQQYVQRFFKNGGRPTGWLKHPSHFKDKDARRRFRLQFQEQFTGDNAGGTPLLEDGVEYQTVGMSNQDAQLLELRRFGIAEIARVFGVPLVLLQETANTTTWGSGVEQFMLAFVMHTLRPWLVRFEQSFSRDLLTPEEADEYFFEFNVSGLLRGDLRARYEAYLKGRTGGWVTVNDIRAWENMNPLDGGNDPGAPLNSNKTTSDTGLPEGESDDNSEGASNG